MTTERATVIETFPREIREVECEFIPLADGTRLSVRYWLPRDALAHPVPAILEYIPYCTRDGTAGRDEAMHPFFAGHGYASLRGRHARQRGIHRPAPRRVPGAGAGRRARGHRLDRGPALVQRPGRHVRQELGRLQLAPGRGPAPARPCGASSRCTSPTTATRTTSTTWAAACSTPTRAGPSRCSGTTRARPIRRSSGTHGATCGSNASRRTARGSSSGCATRPATTSGSTARCARTTPTSRSPSTRWAAGRTPTPTRCRACSRASRPPARRSSVPGATSTCTKPRPVP